MCPAIRIGLVTGLLGNLLLDILCLLVVDLLCGSLNCRLLCQPPACRQSMRECKNWCGFGGCWAKLVGQTNQGKPTPFFIDSQSAEDLALNPVFHKQSKHIEIKYHGIREHVESTDQAADLFTKVLCGPMFEGPCQCGGDEVHEEQI